MSTIGQRVATRASKRRAPNRHPESLWRYFDREPFTYADYARMPEGQRVQILDGELYVSAAPIIFHQKVAYRIHRLLDDELEQKGLGFVYQSPVTVRFDDINVPEPDIAFVRKDRARIIGEKIISGAPDLIVEVLSPSTRALDLGAKADVYARFGVPQYWIADPRASSLRIMRLLDGRYEIESESTAPAIARPRAFPKMRIPLAKIFAK